VDYDKLSRYRQLKGYNVDQQEPEPEVDSEINDEVEPVVYKDAMTEFEKNISDDDENANENLEERQIRYKNKFDSLIKEHDSKRLKLNESEDNDKLIESNEITENTNIQPIENQLKSLRINHNIKSMKMQGQIIFDSGASTCATSDPTLLRHIIYGQGIKATPAFGPAIESKATGLYGPLGLDIILMEGMKETLISISQLCNGGISGSQNVVIFTSEGMRCFSIESIREALALIDKLGVEIIRGYISNGVYVYNPSQEKSINEDVTNKNIINTKHSPICKEITTKSNTSATLYLTQFKPVSLYDHVHMVTGHPGNIGMLWHLKNSTNAKFTEEDANKQRGPCKGCVYGTMHQTGTDHRREHRDLPVKPGQCFSLDAYQHNCYSARGVSIVIFILI
jgi:hypothetical protein